MSTPVSTPGETTGEPIVRPGDVIARKYRVDRVIGAGGMGMVVAATHVALHQTVAIKLMLPTALSSGEAIERFLREGRAVAKLRSPHVPRVVDVGTLETGEPYMVMELLEGEDLAEMLHRTGPLPVADALEYVRQACGALVDAHALGIIHRDLKPANLFVAREGQGAPVVKVLDFGISKSLQQDPTNLALTATSAVMGSPLYMSPEQMRASRDVDARTDIWSLGVTLYELVVGEVPFLAQSPMELGAKVLHEVPVPPAERRPGLPAAINDIILRCLEKDPARRFPGAQALAEALTAARGDSATLAVLAPPGATTGPRVSLGPGGTPPAGSRTLPFSKTIQAEAPAPASRLPRLVAAGAAVALAITGGAVALRTSAPSVTSAAVMEPPGRVDASPTLPSATLAPAPTASAAPLAIAPPVTEVADGGGAVVPARPAPRPAHGAVPTPAHPASVGSSPAKPAPTPADNPLDHL